MLKFSTIRKAKPLPPSPGSALPHDDSPIDNLPLSPLGRGLLAHFTPANAIVNGERRLIWLELWRAHLYPAEYYGPTSHREI